MRKIIVNIARWLLAVVLIFSGYVKAVDPMGTSYKIRDYLDAARLADYVPDVSVMILSVVLSAVEFLLGICLLFAIRRRLVSRLAVVLMTFMTLLTLWLAIANPISDCGCFGDAIVLTNWQTFLKNVVLLGAAAIVASYPLDMMRFVSRSNQWIVVNFSVVYIFATSGVSQYGLPQFDFRPYHIGTNDKGYTFLLVAPHLEDANDSRLDQINEVYEYAQENGYPFYCLTASTDKGINMWIGQTGAEYTFCHTDETTLKTVIRSNPGLVLLKDGTVIRKWGFRQLPDEAQLSEPLSKSELGRLPNDTVMEKITRIFLWFILPLLMLTFADRMWAWSQWLRREGKKTKDISFNHQKKKTNMRKKIVAGNWKMNMNLQDGIALAKELNETLKAEKPNCGVVICTPFIHLASIAQFLDQDIIGLGAENCADKEKGAFTGEVSAEMVKSTGAQYVILGHSERREYYKETPEILKEKVLLAQQNGLKVIFCIGESLAEREAGKQNEVVKAELEGSVFNLSEADFRKIVIAYEPIWAIGTGKTATAEQAEEIHAYIRSIIAEKYGQAVADDTTILYGGSCKASNAPELFAKPDIDGGLIGGASLKAADFKGIIDAFK